MPDRTYEGAMIEDMECSFAEEFAEDTMVRALPTSSLQLFPY